MIKKPLQMGNSAAAFAYLHDRAVVGPLHCSGVAGMSPSPFFIHASDNKGNNTLQVWPFRLVPQL